MRFRNLFLALSLLLLVVSAPAAEAGTFKAAHPETAVEGEYLVVLRAQAAKLSLGSGRKDLPAVSAVAQRLSKQFGVAVLQVWDRALPGFLVQASEKAARRLAAHPLVESVEQNFSAPFDDFQSAPVGSCYGLDSYPYGSIFYRTPPAASPQTLTCSDSDPTHDSGGPSTPPLCQDNWGLDFVDQHSAVRDNVYSWERTGRVPGQVNVTIFILDSGLNVGHREFIGFDGTVRASAVDATGDSSCSPAVDPNGHATHVAGIAAGRIFGVAKDAFVTVLRVARCNGNFNPDYVVSALNSVAGVRPSVVLWSGGNRQDVFNSSTIRTAIQGLVNSGVMFVQSAGNQSSPYPQPGVSPASYLTGVEDACNWTFGGLSGVLVVGGIDQNLSRWTRQISGDLSGSFCVPCTGSPQQCQYYTPDCGSNVGSCIDVWAPAANILSAGRYDPYGYCRLSGTSMAAPHAAGVAALYLQAHPLATPAQVEAAIIASATTGVLNTNTSSPSHIGTTSPNRLLYTKVP